MAKLVDSRKNVVRKSRNKGNFSLSIIISILGEFDFG
jgi:hypothetical protein